MRAIRAGIVFVFALAACVPQLNAATPEWLRAAAREQLPAYDEDTDMAYLLDEEVTTVRDNGEIYTTYRQAWKILRPGGREHNEISVHFDNETKIDFLRGWSISSKGDEYEVKEKDAIETGASPDELYSDTRYKHLRAPADVGSIVGFEWEQRERPYVFNGSWVFQGTHPVRRSRKTVRLAPGWEYKATFANHKGVQPTIAGDTSTWELTDIPAIEPEPNMPAARAVFGRMALTYFSPGGQFADRSHYTWRDIGVWYSRLTVGRRQPSPEIEARAKSLTAAAKTPLDKIRALARFAQKDIRYVAIEIGIGGFQPHPAMDVFRNRYGDCKDKATLLSSMLSVVGIESYYMAIHATRGVNTPTSPVGNNFNHMILAIKLPDGERGDGLHAIIDHPKTGKLLIFDPTDPYTPVGHLPHSLQGNYGLLVSDGAGELLALPNPAPGVNRLKRSAKLTLTAEGRLSGEIVESRFGRYAVDQRGSLLAVTPVDRKKELEKLLQSFTSGLTLNDAEIQNLEDADGELVIKYKFSAENYGKKAGNLLMVRPRVVGAKGEAFEGKKHKPRQYPIELENTALHSDVFEIELPEGYAVDEIPDPAAVVTSFAEYHSKTEVNGRTLKYTRDYKVNGTFVPIEKLDEAKKLFGSINFDERSNAVLKRISP